MRQHERLIVIAGPSAVGKSVLMDAMQTATPDGATGVDLLKTAGSPAWSFLRARDLDTRNYQRTGHEVLHYDLCRKRRHKADLDSGSVMAKRLQLADDLVFVTLWAEPRTLPRRISQRTLRGGPDTRRQKTRSRRNVYRYRNLGKLYRYGINPDRLWPRYYNDSLETCARHDSSQHWVVRTTLPDKWVPLDRHDATLPFWKQGTATELVGTSPGRKYAFRG